MNRQEMCQFDFNGLNEHGVFLGALSRPDWMDTKHFPKLRNASSIICNGKEKNYLVKLNRLRFSNQISQKPFARPGTLSGMIFAT